MTGPGARAVGLELDATTAEAARRHVASPEAVASSDDATSAREGLGRAIAIHAADALAPDARALGLREGGVDAINVGLAVGGTADLAPLARLLRVGGLMAAPLCEAAQPEGVPAGKCAARFRILRKADDGALAPLPADPGVEVTFIRTGSTGTGAPTGDSAPSAPSTALRGTKRR